MQLLPHFVALLSLPFFAQVSGSPIAQRDPPVEHDPSTAASTRVFTAVIGTRTSESVVAAATTTVLEVEEEVITRRTTVIPAEAAPTHAGISGVAIPRTKGVLVPAVPLNRVNAVSAVAQPVAANNIRAGRVIVTSTINRTLNIAATPSPNPVPTRATDDQLRELTIEEEVREIQQFTPTVGADRATPRPTKASSVPEDNDVEDIVEVLGGVPVAEAARRIQASVDQAQTERDAQALAGEELLAEPGISEAILEPAAGALNTGAVDPTTGWRVMRAPMVVVEPGVQVVHAPANAAAQPGTPLSLTNNASVLTTDGSSAPKVVQAPRVPAIQAPVNPQGKQIPDDLSALDELSSRPAYVAAAPRRLVIPQAAVPQGATDVTVIPPVQNIVREVPVAQKVQIGQVPVVSTPVNVVTGQVDRKEENVVVEEQRKIAERPVVLEKKPVVAEKIVETKTTEKIVEPIEKVIEEIEQQESRFAATEVEEVGDEEEGESGASVLDSAVGFASNVVSGLAAVPSKIAQTVAGLAGSVASSNSDDVEEKETPKVEIKKPAARVENPVVEQTKLVRVQKPVVEAPKKVVKVEKPIEKPEVVEEPEEVAVETVEIDEIEKLEILEVSATPSPTPSPVTQTPHVISPVRPAILATTPTRTPVVVLERTVPLVQVVQQKIPVPVTVPVVVNRPVPVPVVVEKEVPVERIVEKTIPTIAPAVAQAPPLSTIVTQTTLSATVIPVATVPVVIAHTSSVPVTISRTVPVVAPLVAAPVLADAPALTTTVTSRPSKTPTTVTQSLIPIAIVTAPAPVNPTPAPATAPAPAAISRTLKTTTIEQEIIPASAAAFSSEEVPLVESCPAPFIRKCCQALIPALDITSKLFDGVQCIEVAKGDKCQDYYRESCCSGEVAGEGRWKWDLGCAGIAQ